MQCCQLQRTRRDMLQKQHRGRCYEPEAVGAYSRRRTMASGNLEDDCLAFFALQGFERQCQILPSDVASHDKVDFAC